MAFFSTSTQILESVHVSGHTTESMSKVHIKAIEKHFWIFKLLYLLENITIWLDLKVPFIHRKQVPLLHNTLLILCDEGDGLVAVIIYISAVLYIFGAS